MRTTCATLSNNVITARPATLTVKPAFSFVLHASNCMGLSGGAALIRDQICALYH